MTRGAIVGAGPHIEGFRWIRALGSGGFADVHLYHQQVPSRDVAIKVARPNVEGGNEAIRYEADAMARVSSHPAIVNLYGVGSLPDGRQFLIMEYCPVANIADQVRARPMDLASALDMMIRISSGVEMLHRSGYVHRDIKPGNIMLDSYKAPVLTDFGVSARRRGCGRQRRRFFGAVGAARAARWELGRGAVSGRVGVGVVAVDAAGGPQPLRGSDWG